MKVREFILGSGLVLWAILLLSPPHRELSWPDLTQLIAILPRASDPALIYAVFSCLAGGAQILGAWRNLNGLRRGAAIAAFTAWAFIACSLIGHAAPVPKFGAYVALALLNIPAALGKHG